MKLIKLPRLLCITSLGFLLLLSGCKRHESQVSGKLPIFYSNQIELPSSSVNLQFSIPYDTILSKLNFKTGAVVVNLPEGNGVDPLMIQLLNTPKISKLNNHVEISNCQLKFKAKPSIAGINAGWIEGKIKLKIQLELNNAPNQVNFTTCSYQYEWVEKPQVKMLGFAVNVAAILDKYIDNNNEKLRVAFLEKINPLVDTQNWLPLVRQKISDNNFGNYQLISNQLEVELDKLNLKENQLNLVIRANGILGIALKQNGLDFIKVNGREVGQVYFYANKFAIQSMLNDALIKNQTLKGKTIQLESFSSTGLQIKTLGMFGNNSELSLKCQLYTTDTTIRLKSAEILLEHIKFPYSLFKHSIQNKIAKRLDGMSIDVNQMLLNVDSNKLLGPITLKELRMNSQGIVLVGKLKQSNLQINP